MYIEDAFRSYWALGLNNIPINKSENLSNWLKKGNDYQIHNAVQKDDFEVNVFERKIFLTPISQDCNRFSCASFESVIKSESFEVLPKSISWILIKQYYSAFYSAHFILRSLGYSLTQLDANVINQVKKVADLYGNLGGVNIENGYYLIDYSHNNNFLKFKKINVSKDGGSHVALWKFFGMKINQLSTEFLTRYSTLEVQSVSNKLVGLVNNLSYVGSNNYSWLTRMRNDLNYKHLYGVWHPYSLHKKQLDLLKRNILLWKSDPMEIELNNLTGKELIRFSNSCQFIISLGYQICRDMSNRCSSGKSYLESGFKQIVNVA